MHILKAKKKCRLIISYGYRWVIWEGRGRLGLASWNSLVTLTRATIQELYKQKPRLSALGEKMEVSMRKWRK